PSFMPQAGPFQAARPPQQDLAAPVALKPPGDMGGLFAPAGEKSLPAVPPGPSPAPVAPAGDSPFTALFGPKVTPTGQPAPDPSRPGPALPSSNGGGQVRLSVAGLLRGYSVAELGFDPLIVPAWIMTTQPAHDVRQWLELPSPQTNLGVLVDNITDVGFRNVLNNAHREFQVLLAREELMRALQGESPPTLPSLASLKPAAPIFPAQPPSGNGGASPFQVSPSQPPSGNGGASPFQVSPAQPPSGNGGTSPFQVSPAQPPSGNGGASSFQVSPAQPPSGNGGASPFQVSPAQPPSGNGGASPFQVSPAPAPAPQPAPREIKAPVFQVMPPAGAPAAQEPAAAPPSPVFGSPPAQTPFSASPPASPPAQPSPFIVQPATPPGAPAFAQQAPAPGFAAAPAAQNHAPGLITPDSARQPVAHVPVPPQVFPVSPDFTPERAGFGSAELMAAPSAPESRPPVPVPQQQQFTPPVERPPQQIAPVFPAIEPAPPPAAQAFIPPVMPAPPASSAPAFTPAASPPRPAHQAAQPALGIQAADSRPDQIMLRALLGTDEELTAQRVVEMTCALPGIAACVCLRGEQALSHIGAHKPQAREFQKQATGLSHHLRSLAPLIGIEGAETFTLTSGDRLMTFCFPENIIFGILHDASPSLGLRDKITLIARELSRMLP
ncbi:MAG TPA: hypothetical protein PLP58_22375, partial [Prosthecobacter sp.]|nr:hypothetical protein [Prosthecobacter sp.]